MEEIKIRREDISREKRSFEVETFIVGGKAMNVVLADAKSIDSYITHEDCKLCGTEFKKRFIYQKTCDECLFKKTREDWEAMELVQWDGKSHLFIHGSDNEYFSKDDDIWSWCEDNEVDPESLMLVMCEKSKFKHIELEHITEDFERVYEDWEPSSEIKKKIKDFNDWIDSKSTNTWFPVDKRVVLF